MKRDILIHPDPRLKKMCDPVPEVTGPIRQLAEEMLETMYQAPGIGLAAPQIGVNARMLVMDCAKRENDQNSARPMCLINPEIIWQADETEEHEEGCLSIPDVYANVSRPAAVSVRFLDQSGAKCEQTFDGIWGVCVQHEIDHLNGKLFIDYLSSMRRRMITSKMQKLKRERARG